MATQPRVNHTANCKKDAVSNFTVSRHDKPHLFCHSCRAHYYGGRHWTRQEWEAYVNS